MCSSVLQGELTITSDMEDLENALFLDQVGLKKTKMFINVSFHTLELMTNLLIEVK